MTRSTYAGWPNTYPGLFRAHYTLEILFLSPYMDRLYLVMTLPGVGPRHPVTIAESTGPWKNTHKACIYYGPIKTFQTHIMFTKLPEIWNLQIKTNYLRTHIIKLSFSRLAFINLSYQTRHSFRKNNSVSRSIHISSSSWPLQFSSVLSVHQNI